MNALQGTLFSLLLTLISYGLGLKIYQQSGRLSLLQPVVIGITLVIVAIVTLHLDLADYLKQVEILNLLLGTATVALAYPLHRNFSLIRANARAIILGVLICGVLSTGIALALAWWFGASLPVLLSLAPKSITTPLAIGVAESIGGYPSLTAGLVILTGIIVAVIASPSFRLLRINDPKVQGLAMGMTGHGIATARAFELNSTVGAFSALGMGLMGLYMATLLPYIALLM